MTGGQLLTRALVFRRLLLRVLAADEKYVGVLLPPTAGGMLANAALSLMGRAAVNLNYTASSEILNACMRQCEARHIVTSKLFMHRMKHLKLDAKLIYLEELVKGVRRSDKLIGAAMAYAMPLPVLDRVLGIHKLSRDDVATIIFTSGSTGEPKGV
ncbi:MAG: AMP-binding protein, partial [Pirellulaceae bacterium]